MTNYVHEPRNTKPLVSKKIARENVEEKLKQKSFAEQKMNTWKLGACDACESGDSASRKPKADC